MSIIDASNREHEASILLLATRMGLTYYDASYLTTAEKLKANLITDDDALIKASMRIGIKTLRSRDIPIKSN
ncbi:MAG: hypothetical protein DRJ68_01340 [Thermoprotei archaeon]|nr:MAG: hypothetical protein DRJ68_01340 [Thermoprotei archaeon]